MDQQWHVPREIKIYRNDLAKSNAQAKFIMEPWLDYRKHFEMDNLSPTAHAKLSKEILSNELAGKRFV